MDSMRNIIIKDVLSEDQIADVYNRINQAPEENSKIQARLGHKAFLIDLGEDLRKHLESIVQKEFGSEWTLNAIQFARYSKKYGYEPKLYPHFDDAFSTHKLTLDVQVKSTIEWPIVVEGKEFLLHDNEAVVFYGTDQIHWRTPVELSEDDVVDMIFCHCDMINDPRGPITPEHTQAMLKREKEWGDKINISREELTVNNDNGK